MRRTNTLLNQADLDKSKDGVMSGRPADLYLYQNFSNDIRKAIDRHIDKIMEAR